MEQTTHHVPQLPDDDAELEATLAQLDEIGINGWIPSSPKKESQKTQCSETKETKQQNERKLKHHIVLESPVTSKNMEVSTPHIPV